MGDLVFNGYDVQFRRFINQVDGLKMPMLTAIGNHDLDPGTHEVAASKTDAKFGSLKNSKNYQKIFGPTYYSFNVGDSYFIVMDISTEFMANTVAQKKYFDDELVWFENELKKSQTYKHRFVFSHVPPFKGKKQLKGTQKDNPEKFLRNPGYSDLIKNLCVKYNVEYMFGCHLHTIDFDLWPKGKTDADGDVISIITGGAGAELWQTKDFRSQNEYTLISIQKLNPVDIETGMPGPTFDPKQVKVLRPEHHVHVHRGAVGDDLHLHLEQFRFAVLVPGGRVPGLRGPGCPHAAPVKEEWGRALHYRRRHKCVGLGFRG